MDPSTLRRGGRVRLGHLTALATTWLVLFFPARCAAQGLAFATGRASSYSAHALYAGYVTGPHVFFAGVLQNPRTDYREALVGVGRVGTVWGVDWTAGVALANTSGGDYAQVYLLPSARVGVLRLDATVTAQVGLAPGSSRDLYVYPATLAVPLTQELSVGATWTLSGTVGEGVGQRLGPSATLRAAGVTFGLHFLQNVAGAQNEMWLTVRVSPGR